MQRDPALQTLSFFFFLAFEWLFPTDSPLVFTPFFSRWFLFLRRVIFGWYFSLSVFWFDRFEVGSREFRISPFWKREREAVVLKLWNSFIQRFSLEYSSICYHSFSFILLFFNTRVADSKDPVRRNFNELSRKCARFCAKLSNKRAYRGYIEQAFNPASRVMA